MRSWSVPPIEGMAGFVTASSKGRGAAAREGRRRFGGKLRVLATLLALLWGVPQGCAPWPRSPGPAALAASDRLAVEISTLDGAGRTGTVADASALRTFALVFDRIRSDYVREVDDDALIEAARKALRKAASEVPKTDDRALVMAAIAGMLSSLDRYSSYLDSEEWRALREQTRGRFGGLGIEVRKGDGYIEVVSPIDGTPAQRAGIRAGDRITHADGVPLGPLTLHAAVRRLRGRVGEPVRLTIERDGGPPFDVVIVREMIRIRPVRWRVEGDIGYLRISAFTKDVGDRVGEAVSGMRGRLAGRLRGLVVDLRNNPGGLFEESLEVADVFLAHGVIVTTRARRSFHRYRAGPGEPGEGLPIVVLINGGSASAAEIVAAALKEQGGAVLVGTRSFGKGTVQSIIPLGKGEALKLTTAVYLAPSGRSVEGGLAPDVSVVMDKARQGDEQLEKAFEIIRALAAGS